MATSARTRAAVTGKTEAPAPVEEITEAPAEAQAEAAEEKTEETAEEKTETVDANADPFAVLAEAVEAVEFVRSSPRIDREKTTPQRVKDDLLKSFVGYVEKKDSDGEIVPNRGTAKWLTQRFPTAAMASMYMDFAKKYAGFRDWTFRSAWMEEVQSGDGKVTLVRSKAEQSKILRFCVKPKETRAVTTPPAPEKVEEKPEENVPEKTEETE